MINLRATMPGWSQFSIWAASKVCKYQSKFRNQGGRRERNPGMRFTPGYLLFDWRQRRRIMCNYAYQALDIEGIAYRT